MSLSKAQQSNAKILIDDLTLVRGYVDEHIVGDKAVPVRIIFEALKGQLSRKMTQNTFAASFSANVLLGTLGNIKGMRPKGYVRVNGVATAPAETESPSRKLKRSSALGPAKPEPEPKFVQCSICYELVPEGWPCGCGKAAKVEEPEVPEPEPEVPEAPPEYRNDTAPLVDEPEPEPAVEPVKPEPQVGPEPKRTRKKATGLGAELSAGAVNEMVRSTTTALAPADHTKPATNSHARHVWVGRRLYRVRGTFEILNAVVFSVLRGRATDDGEVVFNGKRWGGFDAELFERIIVYTLHAWQESSDSEPVLDDGSGIPVELRIGT